MPVERVGRKSPNEAIMEIPGLAGGLGRDEFQKRLAAHPLGLNNLHRTPEGRKSIEFAIDDINFTLETKAIIARRNGKWNAYNNDCIERAVLRNYYS